MIRSDTRAQGRLPIALTLSLSLTLIGMAPGEPAPPAHPDAIASATGVGTGPGPSLIGSSPRPSQPAQTVGSDLLLPPPYKVTSYTIRTLAPDALPYVSSVLPEKVLPARHDADGIPMKLVGTKLYYSPAGLAQYGLMYEDAYRRSGDPDYRTIAAKVLNKLMALGVAYAGGIYIPYRFDFAMHGIKTEVMRAPWYSAMAQGLALSLAVRLYRDTADPLFQRPAALLFESFKHLGRDTNPWVTYIDDGRYLWLEEYPEPTTPSDHTANGFNFAVFGLYDYYQETHDAYALQVLRASLTTMRHYIAAYRRPGSYSKYCLRHGRPQAKYHKIVTWQLEYLSEMSGDAYFLSMSRLFASDYH
jgi:hypothetical protein